MAKINDNDRGLLVGTKDRIPQGLPRKGINVLGSGLSISLKGFLISLYRLSLLKVTITFFYLLPITSSQY